MRLSTEALETQAATVTVHLCPFVILIDNREKAPYSFTELPRKKKYGKGRKGGKNSVPASLYVPTETRYLPTGDYSIDGMEDRFAIERKSLEDLYGTIGQHRERFEAELERLNALDFAAVVIEANQREIWAPSRYRPDWRSKLDPRAVEGSIVAWSIRFPRVHWWAMGGKREAEVRVFEACEKFWGQEEKKRKQKPAAAAAERREG
jgi:DNA excision repair protein ERCC-4